MSDKVPDPNPGHAMFGLNEPQPQQAGAPVPAGPGAPQYIYVQAPPVPATTGVAGVRALTVLVILLVLVSGASLYLLLTARKTLSRHSDELNLVTRRLDSTDARYAQLSGQFQVTRERLGLTRQELSRAQGLAKDIQTQAQATVQQLNEAIAKKASAEEMTKLQEDANTRFGVISGDLAGTKKDLEATKEALLGTKGELTTAIARTHDELVALAHRGDRDYFEFSLTRKSPRQKLGTVLLELQKTNLKKNQYSVNLMFDDKPHLYRDKTANEPVYFYVSGASSALELVVNKLGKDSISGYVSAPKNFFANTPNVLATRPGA